MVCVVRIKSFLVEIGSSMLVDEFDLAQTIGVELAGWHQDANPSSKGFHASDDVG